MNTGQIMLTMGAMTLLSLTSLSVNRHTVDSGIALDESKFTILATSLASSVIEEANNKAFDENTVSDVAIYPTDLSSTLGPEGEDFQNFNDCDDFNNYHRTVDSIPSAKFYIDCQVCYVDTSAPDTPVLSGTKWNKKITVLVSSPSMRDTIKMSSITSYWYFR